MAPFTFRLTRTLAYAFCLFGQATLAVPIQHFAFSQTGYSGGATVTGSFSGSDIDGDGWLNSFVAGELTAYSMAFSGNTVVTPFSHGLLDIVTAGAAGGLVYRLSGPALLGDDVVSPFEGIASGPLGGGSPPPASLFAYRMGFGPTGMNQPFGFVEDNTPPGIANPMGNIDHNFTNFVVVTQIPEPATAMLIGLGLMALVGLARSPARNAYDETYLIFGHDGALADLDTTTMSSSR